MGDSMCKTTMFCIHALAVGMLMTAATYIYLNETGKLSKVKRECSNKVMDIKDDLKEKLQ